MSEIIFRDLKVECIFNKRLKNSYISIKYADEYSKNTTAKVVVKTPNSMEYVKNLLQTRQEWIYKHIQKLEQNPPRIVNLEDEVMLFGEIYSIDVDEASRLKELLNKLRVSTKENILKSYDIFYKEKAIEYITKRLQHYSSVMQLDYSVIKFRKMKSRWGSCGANKNLTFNTELIKVKKELIDYVVVHELAHLVHMNHSKRFHDLVEYYLADSKSLRKELKSINL